MSKDYYNIKMCNEAIDLLSENPTLSLKKLEQYKLNYPQDYSAYSIIASAYIVNNEFDKANKYIRKIEKYLENGTIKHRREDIEAYYAFTKIKYLIYTHNYKECIDFFNRYKKILYNNKIGLNVAIQYVSKQLDKLYLKKTEKNGYVVNQIIEYSEDDFLEHIKKHTAEYNETAQDRNAAVFELDFKLDKVLDYIKTIIPNNNKINPGIFDNTYYFKYDECGRINYKLTDYFKVVAFDNTNNLITIYPTFINEYTKYTDLNFLTDKKEEIKVKTYSRIDKFNQKYNLK